MKEYLLQHQMWTQDVLQTYVRKIGKPITALDADIDLNDSRTTFMDFPTVLESGKQIERVVFTGVKASDWFFGKVLGCRFPKKEAEAYRRLFLDADAGRKAKKDADEAYTDEFCRAEFSGRRIRFHVAPSPSGSAGASDDRWFSGIYRNLLALDSFPAIRLTDMSDAEIRAYALADNKLAENAGWDRSALAVELGELQIALPECGLDLAITGFDPGYRANCQTAGPIGLIGGQRDLRRKSPGVPLLHFIPTVVM